MLTIADKKAQDEEELVLYWTAAPDARCVLVAARDTIELRLLSHEAVVRRAPNLDTRFARDVARQWQIEYDFAHGWRDVVSVDICPECGDDASSTFVIGFGVQRALCRSCGHEWVLAQARGR